MATYAQPYVPGPIKQSKILLPENTHYRKVVLYKIRLRKGEPWYGSGGDGSPNAPGPITVPYNLDIDEAQIDGMSIRRHIHLRMTGVLERAYGQFVWQESDQMQATTYIEEWPEVEWLKQHDRIWSQFVRQEPTEG